MHVESNRRVGLSPNTKHQILPIGTEFNLLTICSKPYKRVGMSQIYYDCVCECGNTTSVRSSSLCLGRREPDNTHAIRSCGCKRNETIKNKIKPHQCSCGETDPQKFGRCNKSKCARCYFSEKYHGNSETAYFTRLISGVRSRAHRKDKKQIECTVNRHYLINLWKKQGGHCAITGLDMVLAKRSLSSASVDRKDSSKGYTADNIQLVCVAVNLAKRDFTDSQTRQFFDNYAMQYLANNS